MEKNNYSLPISIVIAGILIAGGIYLVSRDGAGGIVGGGSVTNVPTVTLSDHIMGNPKAQLKIVEYSDMECPYCKHFDQTMREIMQYYGASGKVAWVFRNFPLITIHENAATEAAATECAAEQGGSEAFFKFTDKIYQATAEDGSLDLSSIPALAKEAGLDGQKLKECVDSGTYKAKVQQQYKEALATGAQGTPHIVFMLGNTPILILEGNQPYSSIHGAVEQILQTEGSTNPSSSGQ